MQKFGIDISRWQGDFNLAKAKDEGVEYAIIKIGGADDGYYVDSQFYNNVNKAKAIDMPIGGYYFGNAYTVEQTKKEARHCLNLIAGLSFDYPVFYDVEAKMLNAGENLTEIVKAFTEEIANAGYKAGLYMSEYYMNKYIDIASLTETGYYLWTAKYSDTSPILKDNVKCDIWQFGGSVNFIRENTVAGVVADQNYCYTDFTPVVPVPDEPTNNLKVGDVITLRQGCTYYNGEAIPDWVFGVTLYYRGTNDNGIIFSCQPTGAITGVVSKADVMELQTPPTQTKTVRIKEGAKDLNTNTMYANYVYTREYDVIDITDTYVVFGIGTAVTGKVAINDVIFV